MKNENGFSLVEVLAAIVLISIVFIGFIGLFGTTNRLAVTNSEKLVLINLADSHLERLRTDPVLYFNNKGYNFPPMNLKNGTDTTGTDLINGRTYDVHIDLTQNNEEQNLSLFNVIVTVKSQSSNLSSTVEGYLPYVQP